MFDRKALPILRKNIDAFIRADPVELVLFRQFRVKTEANGWILGDPVPLDPQQFRVTWFTRRLSRSLVHTAQGKIPIGSYVLVGRWNADMMAGDEFEYNNDHYKIEEIEAQSNDRAHTDRVVGILREEAHDPSPPVTI